MQNRSAPESLVKDSSNSCHATAAKRATARLIVVAGERGRRSLSPCQRVRAGRIRPKSASEILGPAMWIVTGRPRPFAGSGSEASRATVPRSGRRITAQSGRA